MFAKIKAALESEKGRIVVREVKIFVVTAVVVTATAYLVKSTVDLITNEMAVKESDNIVQ